MKVTGMEIEFDSNYVFGMLTIDQLIFFILDLIIQKEDYNIKYQFKILAGENAYIFFLLYF